MYDESKRSVLKSISWRIIATSTTMFLVYIFTGQLVFTLGIGFFDVVLKILFYILHERVWNRIEFGRRRIIKEMT
jgi:adenylylsulfate kinase